MTSAPTLSRRARNRAFLARQLLLERAELAPLDAVAHLVGLQAQSPQPPYVALWSRLRGFDPHELGAALTDRRAVRLLLLRSTVHLVTAHDALALRPLVQDVLDRQFATPFGKRLGDEVDADAVVAAGRELLAAEPLVPADLGRRLAARFGGDAEALAMLLRARGVLVQVPPRGVWGQGGLARHTTLEAWLGRPPGPPLPLADLALRYLAAFGPASVADLQTWCGLTRLKPVIDALRPQLLAFRGEEDGRELLDLPGAPRPDPDTPAPVRFLGEFDNALLSHADRSHLIDPAIGGRLDGRQNVGSVLVDGCVAARWRVRREGDAATLEVLPGRRLTRAERTAVADEGDALLRGLVAQGARSREIVVSAAAEG